MQNVTIDRNKYIGGSDIAIIMGISPFKKRFDLLLEKAELKENDFEGNEYTEYGNVMEEKIRNYINESEKDKFVEGKTIKGDIRCHTDGENKTTILEIKTTSKIYDNVDEYKIYLVQLLFYMQETGRKKGKLAVYNRPEDFNTDFYSENLVVYDINIKDYTNTLEDINQAVECFRNDLKKIKENPFMTEEELLPKKVVEVSAQLEILENKLKEYKQLEEEEKKLKESLKEAMETYKIKNWTTPSGTKITLVPTGEDKEVITKEINEEKFKEENQELYEQYHEVEKKYETEKKTIKKGRAGYVKITLMKEENE